MNLKKNSALLGTILIFLFLSYHIYINIEDENKQEQQNLVINKTFIESSPNVDKEYLGYIEIPKYKIKRLIKKGTDKKNLDDGYIGLLDNTAIDKGNTVLAGHNINKIFKVLHQIEKNDQVIITTYSNKYVYYVTQKREISVDDFSYFENTDEKLLTLITCTDDNNKRLMVRLKLLR